MIHDEAIPGIEPVLDRDAIATRRLELGLSMEDMARELGSTVSGYTGFETRLHHGRTDLGQVCAVASVLGLTLDQMLLTPPARASERGDDDVRVEAALLEARRTVSAEDLAYVFGWKLERTYAALRTLHERTRTTGAQLRRPAGYLLTHAPHVLTPSERQRLSRRRVARRGIDIGETKLLYRLLHGERLGTSGSSLGRRDRRRLVS